MKDDFKHPPEVLIRIAEWEVRIDLIVDKEPWAAHVTCPKPDTGMCDMRYSWFTTDAHNMCCFCKEQVPDEVQALVRLHKGEM